MRIQPFLVLACSTAALVQACQTVVDCSAAGQCVNNHCVCEPGYIGPSCSFFGNTTALRVKSGLNLTASGWNVWGSQVVYSTDDGLWHMLASVYPLNISFAVSWLTNAQIVHAVAATPYGPFENESLALAYAGESDWDRSVMNPKALRAPDGTWLLFYTGDTYPGPWPNASDPGTFNWQAQSAQRVGVAFSATPEGPYTRLGAPILQPRPGKWDSRMVTNPALTLMADGKSYLMIYKSSNPPYPGKQSQVCIGAAIAPDWRGPFTRVSDEPILPCPANTFLYEDPTVWYDKNSGWYHALIKQASPYLGLHAISADGIAWNFTSPALAYTTTHLWDDRVVRTQHRQERAQVLLDPQDGSPLGVYYATDTGLDGEPLFWNMYQPAR